MRSLLSLLSGFSRRPKPPFTDQIGDKGWLNGFADAQPCQENRLSISIPEWNGRTRPLKISVLADVHLGSHSNDLNRLSEIVAKVNAWKPDVILLLGDFINNQLFFQGWICPKKIAELLSPLESRLGVFSVLGNHDWYYDGYAVWDALEQNGIQVLENASVKIMDEIGDFWIVGLADQKTRRPDVEPVFENLPKSDPALVMAHDPATFQAIPEGPYLTLCGHTHGGQCCLPFIGPIVNSSQAPLRWTSGYIIEDRRHLFVSRGLGTSGLPLRFFCPPEIGFITLVGEKERADNLI